jgi:uncharacterized membrane protein
MEDQPRLKHASDMARRALPLHPVLVSFPTALWIFGFACDVATLVDRENAIWPSIALYALTAGVVAGVATAIPEWIDFWSLRKPETRALARRQLVVNTTTLAIFAIDVGARLTDALGLQAPVLITFAGILFLLFAGRLGGDPAYVRGTVDGPETSGS